MRYQITGYDILKDGQFTILYCIDLQKRCSAGYKPLVVKRGEKITEGLFISRDIGFIATKDCLNKVVKVDFNERGYPTLIELEKS